MLVHNPELQRLGNRQTHCQQPDDQDEAHCPGQLDTTCCSCSVYSSGYL
jgi:hypothetical protein